MEKNVHISNSLDTKWMKAAVLGSIWASSEIIFGSYLHNIKLPFSGTLLSAIAVYILTAFDAKWKMNGVIIRAGIICALMKSISPSAVIFGPMIAIFTESLLFSASVRMFGRNFIGYALGGALVVVWSLIHKILNMLILYGLNIITIYENLYKYAEKVTKLHLGSPENLIIIMFSAYLLVGATVAIWSYAAARKAKPFTAELHLAETDFLSLSKGSTTHTKYSVTFLILQFIFITLGMFLLTYTSWWYGILFVFIVTVVHYAQYKQLITKRFKPKFWIELTIITMLAGLLMHGIQNGSLQFSEKSLFEGLKITIRAILLTQCFAVIGHELTNPVIKSLFARMRLGQLPTALEVAFQALPIMLSYISGYKEKRKTPSRIISGFIYLADEWIAGRIQTAPDGKKQEQNTPNAEDRE